MQPSIKSHIFEIYPPLPRLSNNIFQLLLSPYPCGSCISEIMWLQTFPSWGSALKQKRKYCSMQMRNVALCINCGVALCSLICLLEGFQYFQGLWLRNCVNNIRNNFVYEGLVVSDNFHLVIDIVIGSLELRNNEFWCNPMMVIMFSITCLQSK